MKSGQGKIVLYVGVIFLSGVILGVFGYRLYTASRVDAKVAQSTGSFRARYMAEMQLRLNLSDTQFSKLNGIMDETRDRMQDFNHKVVNPEMQRIRDEQIDKIRDMLQPEQKMEYEKLRKERDERQKRTGSIFNN